MVLEKQLQLGKLAQVFSRWKKVGLVAADTFRAAAVDQLRIWSERTKSEFFQQKKNLILQL